MKITLTILFVCLMSTWVIAQTFTAVTTGEIYNDSSALGSAWGDFNLDGYLDLFASAGQLYFNNGDGTFTKVLEGDIVEEGYGIGGTIGDYDNDGYPDLYSASSGSGGGPGRLFRNNGDETFTRVLDEPFLIDTADFQASSWVDIENDGDLDLFITAGGNVGYMNNHLYINNGDGTFIRDSLNSITQDNTGSINCSWSDFNNDGFQDLFVANQLFGLEDGLNLLYLNNGDGSFTQLSAGTITDDIDPNLGSSWGDYDNDGYMDLFVTNNGVNRLYHNNGDLTFTPVEAGELTSDGDVTSSSCWEDFDNDGDIDLIVANIIGEGAYYENDGAGSFTKVMGEDFSEHGSFGCSTADWDKDGDMDILFTLSTDGSNHRPYLNDGNSNNWIDIALTGVISNTSAIGARVKVLANIDGTPTWQLREISGQTGVLSQSSPHAHFGLGDAQSIDTLIVEWPSGIEQGYADFPINIHMEIIENEVISVDEVHGLNGHVQVFPNPTSGWLTLNSRYKIEQVLLSDHRGRLVLTLIDPNEQIDISSLSKGLYHLEVITTDGNMKTKVLLR